MRFQEPLSVLASRSRWCCPRALAVGLVCCASLVAACGSWVFQANAAQDKQDDQGNAKQDKAASEAADKAALADIQNMFIGEWRGVGQPRRGSSRDSWIETANWSWKFANGHAFLAFNASDSKYYASGRIMPGDAVGKFTLVGVTAEGKEETFAGTRDEDGTLTFVSTDAAADRPAKITLRNVASGDRLLVLLERRLSEDRFTRLAEIGYTRLGSDFGQGTSSGPECVVTGGLGTIPVEHKGETYYVCCTGCQDLFNEDPERILAEYAQRKADEKAKKAGK